MDLYNLLFFAIIKFVILFGKGNNQELDYNKINESSK